MSLLVVKLPPRERLGARAAVGEAAHGMKLPTEWPYVFSADGRQPGPLARAPAGLMPKADRVVLVLAETDASWHQVLVPKAPAARMRTALAGVMEELLLDDDDAVHLALGQGVVPGQMGWVAATNRQRLAAALVALETAGLSVERVVTAVPQPGASLRGHFSHIESLAAGNDASGLSGVDAESEPGLNLSSPDAAWWLPLSAATGAGLAATLRPVSADDGLAQRWTTTPAAALAAERFMDAAVALQTEAEHLLEAAQAPVNLRQFDLAARHRGTRALREGGKRLLSADWRPVRFGLLVLLVLQVVGLNAHAWQQQQAVLAQRAAMDQLLRTAHPTVRTILDAPAQMAAETARLRALSGQPGGSDLEVMLNAAAAAWPQELGPVATLRYEGGQLTLGTAGWRDADVSGFRERLGAAGWDLEAADGRVTISKLSTAGSAAPAGGRP